jgi:hypothetical protein
MSDGNQSLDPQMYRDFKRELDELEKKLSS